MRQRRGKPKSEVQSRLGGKHSPSITKGGYNVRRCEIRTYDEGFLGVATRKGGQVKGLRDFQKKIFCQKSPQRWAAAPEVRDTRCRGARLRRESPDASGIRRAGEQESEAQATVSLALLRAYCMQAGTYLWRTGAVMFALMKRLILSLVIAAILLAEIGWFIAPRKGDMVREPYRHAELMEAFHNYDSSSPATVAALKREMDLHDQHRANIGLETAAVLVILDAIVFSFLWYFGAREIDTT
jgi:hypothetical protein